MKKKVQKKVQECVNKFGYIKVNLTRDESSTGGEGCLVTPCTQKDNNIYKNESKEGLKFNVFLCIQPFSWHGINWGDKLVAINGGSSRAYARLSDNPEANHDELTEKRIVKQVWENGSTSGFIN